MVSLPHVSVLFLAAVVMAAAFWGFWPAVLAAVLSVAAGAYFFYSPIFSFAVTGPQDMADLAVFVIVAAFTSRLAAGMRARAVEAQRRQETIGGLLAFAERIAGSADDADLHAVIVEHLGAVLGRPLHLLLSAESPDPGAPPEVRAAAARLMAGEAALVAGWRLERLGTAGVAAAREPGPPADPEYVRGLISHAAVALERARLRREVADARLRAQGEALREALLNSVSHDLQTPLAAILGSATALESFGGQGAPGASRELVATIREESERLASYIENVLDLTRIRSGHLAPRLELVELADIVNAALRRKQRQLAGHAVEVDLPGDLPMLRLDLFLMEHALANVLDNAAKFAPAGSALRVAARRHNGEVEIEVSDSGRGIGVGDLPHVFEPFYQGAEPAGGSGLGLTICRAFVEANGGSIAIASPGAGQGATVRLTLPVPQGGAEVTLGDE